MVPPPFCNSPVRLHFVAPWTAYPRVRLKVVFADGVAILAHVAVQGRMIDFVHRDFEPANGPFRHVILKPLSYHMITTMASQFRKAALGATYKRIEVVPLASCKTIAA
jgi:hypothetical protein